MAPCILILAPRGRDAPVIRQVLERDAMPCRICTDLGELCDLLDSETCGILVAEEALAGPDLDSLLARCEAQPPWSDLPVIVLATRQSGHRSGAAAGVLQRLGNVMLLERPVNAETLASAARAARRARGRQHQARELLLQTEHDAGKLRELNETLEQRVAERTREAEQARATLAFALNSAGMGSWDLDLSTGQSRRSRQHDRIFGYPEPLPVWDVARFLEHVLEEERASAAAALAQAQHHGGLDLQCRIRRADGAVRWISAKGRSEYDGSGRPLRMAGVVMDTTDRRLTEDALHQAQKMEAIGKLTGGVAHDFNNLLTVIVGGLDLIIRRPEQTDRVVRLAQAGMIAARRGEQLTQQLLAFSRRQMLRPVTLDPNRLLQEFEALAQRAIGEAVTLRLELDPQVRPIRVDPAQFESAMLNLVVNARDAMPNGGSIVVRTRMVQLGGEVEHELPAGQYAEIAVTDDGSGIDAATLARAFEPFFTTKEIGRGSGLGLSQVYGFTRSAGGTVAIDSELDRGTTVRLLLPRSAEAAVEERVAAPEPSANGAATAGETVLLVEDDEQVLGMAVESLEELHYDVVVARDARQALEQLHDGRRIDVLFSDVVMPGGMSGAQLASEARRLRPELKVLLTSGYIGEPSHAIGDDVIVLNKPYRRDELALKLRLVLAGG